MGNDEIKIFCKDVEIEIKKGDLIEQIKKDIEEHKDDLIVKILRPTDYQIKEHLKEMKEVLNKLLSIKKLIEFCDKYNIKYSYNNYPKSNINVIVKVEPGEKDDEAFVINIYYPEGKINTIDDVIKLQEKYIKQQEEMIKELEEKIRVKLYDLYNLGL